MTAKTLTTLMDRNTVIDPKRFKEFKMTIPTVTESAIKAGQYTGTVEAIDVLCGAPKDTDAMLTRWTAHAEHCGWSKGDAHAGWCALVDAYYDRLGK